MEFIIRLYTKYARVAAYLFFGVCTTIVNMVVFWCFFHQLKLQTVPSAVIAWGAAVMFAYVTNRKWVFGSEAVGLTEIVSEISKFFLCRVTTGLIDWIGMWILVDLMGFNSMVMKFILNVTVIVLNYIASKLIVFKRKLYCK